jgi:hypothetical protein
VHNHGEQLFDIEDDPEELRDILPQAEVSTVKYLRQYLFDHFDPDDIEERARRSQRNRRFIYEHAVQENTPASG